MTDLTLNVSRIIDAPIEKVFNAWLDPEMLTKFILPMPGMPQPDVQTDGEEGGGFTIVMHVGEDKIPHSGKYLEITRHSKLVFTWESPFSPDDSTVTLDFKTVDDNKTAVDLTHVKFLHEDARQDHEGGWTTILDTLNSVLV